MAKAHPKTALTVLSDKYCIHVTNLCPSVSAEDLAEKFVIPIQMIIVDTVNKEAWINNIYNKQTAENKAAQHNGQRYGRLVANCKSMLEQVQLSELCTFFSNNACRNTDAKCRRKHVKCQDYDTCSQEHCYLGHSAHPSLPQLVPPINFDGRQNTFFLSIASMKMIDWCIHEIFRAVYVGKLRSRPGR